MPSTKKRTKKKTIDPVVANMEKRNRLAELLTIAAQIEHDVMAQYLFAANLDLIDSCAAQQSVRAPLCLQSAQHLH